MMSGNIQTSGNKHLSAPGRLVFFGNEQLATAVKSEAPILQYLIKRNFRPAAIVLHQASAISRRTPVPAAIKIATDAGIPVLLNVSPDELIRRLAAIKPTAGILVSYGQMVPAAVINLFKSGIINLHPSLLPAYRGPTPIESVILRGDRFSGVSLMRLVPALDRGPLLAQRRLHLSGRESKQQLADKLLELGQRLLESQLENILSNQAIYQPQTGSAVSYTRLIKKGDGRLDWRLPAIKIERQIRAYRGWPGSYGRLGKVDVIITAALASMATGSPVSPPGTLHITPNNRLLVTTGEGHLEIQTLKPIGSHDMSIDAFLAGYRRFLVAT